MILKSHRSIVVLLLVGMGYLGWQYLPLPAFGDWSEEEQRLMSSLSLQNLGAVPSDPSNRYADNELAAEFGQRLFFDPRLSTSGTVSCASCHQPEKMFSDGLARGVGIAMGDRHTPTLVGTAYSPWFYWNGRKDSQWSQALEPLENPLEHGGARSFYAVLMASEASYAQAYEAVFGPLPTALVDAVANDSIPAHASPVGALDAQLSWSGLSNAQRAAIDSVFVNLGKALAAYQRKLLPGVSRFDHYVSAVEEQGKYRQGGILTANERAGLRLFLGKAECINCHNGPLLSNHAFHNTGLLSLPSQLPSAGRSEGLEIVLDDPFNCVGRHSDAGPADCGELRFARRGDELIGAHKTPTLRNVAETAPYMHGGQLATLREVISHYDNGIEAMIGHNEAEPLSLRPIERRQLEAFLHTLSAPLATPRKWLRPPP